MVSVKTFFASLISKAIPSCIEMMCTFHLEAVHPTESLAMHLYFLLPAMTCPRAWLWV